MKLSEFYKDKPPKILLAGDVGGGKTALALTLGARAQVIDMDDGLRTGVALQDKWTPERLSVDVKQFIETDPAKKASAFAAMKNYVYGIQAEINSKKFPFDALILDSLTSFGDSAVASIMANSGRIGQNPEIQHWGLAFTEIKNVLGVLRSLPIVVVLITHEQVKTIGKGNDSEDKVEIAVPGKNLPSQICRYFDEIWVLKTKPAGGGKFTRRLQTVSDGLRTARSRGCLPNELDTECGMWEIIKKLGYVPPQRSVVDDKG